MKPKKADRGIPIQGRIASDELRREMRAECLRRGISFEQWVGYVVLKAYKAKDYPPKEK